VTSPGAILLVEDDPSDVLLIRQAPVAFDATLGLVRRVDELRPYLSEKPELS